VAKLEYECFQTVNTYCLIGKTGFGPELSVLTCSVQYHAITQLMMCTNFKNQKCSQVLKFKKILLVHALTLSLLKFNPVAVLTNAKKWHFLVMLFLRLE